MNKTFTLILLFALTACGDAPPAAPSTAPPIAGGGPQPTTDPVILKALAPKKIKRKKKLEDPPEGPLQVGKPAKPFNFFQWHGSQPMTLESLRGRVVVVRFWTLGCKFCEASMPALQQLANEFSRQPVTFIGAFHSKPYGSAGSWGRVIQQVVKWRVRFPIANDIQWKTLRAWWTSGASPRATSATFVIGADGRVAHIHPGPEFHRAGVKCNVNPARCGHGYSMLRQAIRTAVQAAED